MNSAIGQKNMQLVDSSTPLTVQLNSRLFVRVYSDTRPKCLETAPLQKGLVLMIDHEELTEEGVGFGVPVVKYTDKTFFSSTAQISSQNNVAIIKKTFILNAISLKTWQNRYIQDDLYSFFRKTFEKLYTKNKTAFPLFNRLMELRDSAQIKTMFAKANSRGKITITYYCKPESIYVNVDFSGLSLKDCQEILVLNEQGSKFDKYFDSDGLELTGYSIGAWEKVAASEASLLYPNKAIAFGIKKTSGALLFRGWERTRNRFSWAGLSYSLRPNRGRFDYTIKLKVG